MFENINYFPELETPRLKLVLPDLQFLNDFHKMRSNPEMMKYIPAGLAKTIEDSKNVLEKCIQWKEDGNNISWGIIDKETNKLIGTIGYYRIQWNNFRGEIGYILDPGYQGKGIMTEAMREILKYGFEKLNFHTIEAVIDPLNKPSENILIRNGFIKEAYFKENFFSDGKFYDSLVYTRFK